MKPILLFDIDGTLLRIKHKFMSSLITDILKSLSLDETILDNLSFAGKTDQSIFRSLLGPKKQDDRLYQKLKERYITGMHERLNAEHVTIFKHVKTCLNYFEESNYHLGLLTGNYKETAARKLGLADIKNYFTFGAFGCDHTDRNMLGKAAQRSFLQEHNSEAEPQEFLIIGDTPLDIQCAKYFGCQIVVVTTGQFSKEELSKFKPDLILDSLEDPEEWLGQFKF